MDIGIINDGKSVVMFTKGYGAGKKNTMESFRYGGVPGAPLLSDCGEFEVGVTTVQTVRQNAVDVERLGEDVNASYNRPLTLEIWYPATPAPGSSPAVYQDVLSSDSALPKRPYSFAGLAVRDAPPKTGSKHPLVVVTHGYPGSRTAMTWLTENLASKGYVVVALDVTDSTHDDIGPRAITLLHRPLDVLFAIDSLVAASIESGSLLHGLVDSDNVALIGYSMGGYASLNVVGAGLAKGFVDYPGSVPAGKLAVREQGNAEFEASLDPRIKCLVAISPWGGSVAWQDASQLQDIRVPVFFVCGDQDDIAGYRPGVRTLYEWATATDAMLLTLEGAGHSIGLNPAPPEAVNAADYFHYADDVWEQRHINNVLQHFITAFVGRHLRADSSFDAFLRIPERGVPLSGGINAENVAREVANWPGFDGGGARGLTLERRMQNPSLPQHDLGKNARKALLEQQQQIYAYDHETYGPLAMSASVPEDDRFPAAWWAVNLRVMADLLENAANVMRVRKPLIKVAPEVWPLIDEARSFTGDVPAAIILLGNITAAMEPLAQVGRPASFADYASLFQSIAAPASVYRSQDDFWFAQGFLSGANPMILERLSTLDEKRMALSDVLVQATLGGEVSLAEALARHRIYIADYGVLAGAATGTYVDGTRKYLPAPIAYFGVSDDGALLPIAIQIDDTPTSNIATPADGVAWLGARTAVMVADANMSAVYYHHAKTHMVLEPIIVAAKRQLAATHPLRVLLEPHFIGTLAINRTGQQTVFSAGGMISTVGAATRPTFRQVSITAVQTQSVRDLALPKSLAGRGVADPSLLPDFAFRDDGLLLWGAIEGWVKDYLDIYYANDDDVRNDGELNAWFAELGAEDGGRLVGLGELKTKGDLVDLATITIFTASAQHWALNGPLATLMTFAPNYPLAMWDRPGLTSSVDEWLAMLPPLEMAQVQLSAAYGMGKTQYTVLADFPADHFTDHRIAGALATYRARLDQIEATIIERNKKRKAPYPYLIPSQLPASINI